MKPSKDMNGFFVAAITPFTAEGRINESALEQLLDRVAAQGAKGVLMGGSSGECLLLSFEERVRTFEIAAQFKDRLRLIASCAAVSTQEATAYGYAAKALGYDALISTVPNYYKFGMKQISQFFRDVKASTDMPLLLYNFPGNTGIEIDFDDPHIAALLTDGTLCGVKQTSLNLYQIERFKHLNPALCVYCGYDEVYLGTRILGADGAIGSTFNFTLPLFTAMESAYARLDLPAAQALQTRANNIMQACVREGLFPSIKHILCTQGIDVGICRAPFPTLDAQQKARIERVVADNL